jgi:hypothetical protein
MPRATRVAGVTGVTGVTGLTGLTGATRVKWGPQRAAGPGGEESRGGSERTVNR